MGALERLQVGVQFLKPSLTLVTIAYEDLITHDCWPFLQDAVVNGSEALAELSVYDR